MSGLRFFDDLMAEAIESERRLAHIRTIERNATAYVHAATEGMNACRIIMKVDSNDLDHPN